MALRVLAHFEPGSRVLDFSAPDSDWLDVRWCADDESFYRELPQAEVIWHVLRPLTESDLNKARRVRLVHKFGAGVNTVDVDAAARQGVAVANMPGANAPSVAEGTVLLMLAAIRRLPVLDRATRAGCGWPSDPQLGDTVRDIGNCTVGLVGFGNIAKRVAGIVAAMGATVLHTSTRDDGLPGWRPLPDLLADSDIVSLHLPLTAERVSIGNSEAPFLASLDQFVDFVRDGRFDQVGQNRAGQLIAEGHAAKLLNLRSTLLTLAGGDAMPSAAISKLLSMRTGQCYAEFGLSLFGAEGAVADPDRLSGKWAEFLLASRATTIYGGTSEVQLNIIAERLLGLPRDP